MLKRPIYIDLEGADLTGKSTLLKTTFKQGDFSKILCFHDRGILTHFLYNMIFERYDEDASLWRNELYNFIENNGIIILVGSDAELVNRYQLRSDDIFKLSHILKVNKAYKKFYRDFLSTFHTVKLIEIDGKTPQQIYNDAESFYTYMLGRGKV
jgi:thymidylate kinase